MHRLCGAARDRPNHPAGDVLHPDVEMHLHPLGARSTRPHGTRIVLLELDLYLGTSIFRTQSRPSVTRRVARPRADDLLDVPAQQLFIESRELRNVRSVEHGARHLYARTFHDYRLPSCGAKYQRGLRDLVFASLAEHRTRFCADAQWSPAMLNPATL